MSPHQNRPSDEDLIRRFRAGDSRAFDLLVERHMKRIYKLAYRLTGNHDDADDLAQETFIRAHRGLARFRGDSRLETWLTRILLNRARNPRRRSLSVEPGAEAAPAGAGALEALLRAERQQRVRRAISRLPERQRQTLLLRLFEGLRFQEIGALLGIRSGTARANFFHALKGVARHLAEDRP